MTSDPDSIDFELAHRWISKTYWSTNIPKDRFEEACKRSLLFAAFDGEQQIGFARVVTDGATFAWLCDVFVAEHARGRGVSRRLIEAILVDRQLQGLRRFLLATRDAQGLYQKFGFEPVGDVGGRFYMHIARQPSEVYRG